MGRLSVKIPARARTRRGRSRAVLLRSIRASIPFGEHDKAATGVPARCWPRATPYRIRRAQLATRKELSDFLAEVERRAYKQALFAVRDQHTALDIVQDAMLRLSEKYGARPAEELPMLFQRILQNAIRDHYRRQKVRSFWVSPLSALKGGDADDDDSDPLETLRVDAGTKSASEQPMEALHQAQVLGLIEKALESLPFRQRQAFLLRYWEEMDVAEAAQVMGCSQGSVKTHCSRATHAIAAFLKNKGFEP